MGKIRKYSKGPVEERLKVHSEKVASGCIEWTGSTDRSGYGQIRISKKLWPAHRAAYEYLVEPIPEGLHVCHTCDNKRCINIEHLFVGTRNDNMRDMVQKGYRDIKGEKSPGNKLTNKEVLSIRQEYSGKYGDYRKLGKAYSVHPSTITAIIKRTTWTHL